MLWRMNGRHGVQQPFSALTLPLSFTQPCILFGDWYWGTLWLWWVRSFGSSSKPNIPCMISCIMLFVMTPVTPICVSLRNVMLGWLLISFSCAPVLYSPPLSQMPFFDCMLLCSVQLGKEVYVASHALWLVCFVWIFKQQICRMSFTDAVVFIPHALLLEPCELYWENTFQYNNTLFFRCLP